LIIFALQAEHECMGKVVFKQRPGKSPELFPANIFDKIPANHPVRLVDQVVEQLDITELLKRYKGGGTSAYHPRMMLKVIFYSYLSNVYSCRKIAKALQENIHFMWIFGAKSSKSLSIGCLQRWCGCWWTWAM
jgi:transposase